MATMVTFISLTLIICCCLPQIQALFQHRLQKFILRAFNKDNKEVFNYTDTEPIPRQVYTIQLENPLSDVTRVNVEDTSTGSVSKIKHPPISDLEVFGDFLCPIGHKCFHGCKHSSTGEGCKHGLTGEGCKHSSTEEGCKHGSTGEGCKHGSTGEGCKHGLTGEGCKHSSTEEGCKHGSTGEGCRHGSTGEGCKHGSTGEGCQHKKVCPMGWFGPHCRFMCHCTNDNCNIHNGHCVEGAICQLGWFGPACQYYDLCTSDTFVKGDDALEILTDGNDTTCIDGITNQVTMAWTRPFYFTWLRVHVKDAKFLRSLDFQFYNGGRKLQVQCSHERSGIICDTIMDIYCNVSKLVTQVTITGPGVHYLCSVYISGGRNVALKEPISLSGISFSHVSSNAAEGSTHGDLGKNKGTHTIEDDMKPNINLTFTNRVTVNRFVVYNKVAICDGSWFGASCQYRCRCASSCTMDGQCTSGGCLGGWFGPNCQYADLAYNNTSTITDGDDNTCLTSSPSGNTITVPLKNQIIFTWLRVRVSNSDSHDLSVPFLIIRFVQRLTVKFNDGVACLNFRSAVVDESTVDIYCDVGKLVQSVTLSGEEVRHLCSVYISGGRNVALKQYTTQSSTYSEYSRNTDWNHISFPSSLSVDSNTNGNFYKTKTCSCTQPHKTSANWNVSFRLTQSVQRYVLYNQDGDSAIRMIGFNLQSFDQVGTVTFNYTDPNSQALPVYTVTPPINMTSQVSLVTITAMTDKRETFLQMCEVEVYGESVCDRGKYGHECEHDCNCDRGEACFISTGGCPSGCKAGFYGESCNLLCDSGWFGSQCQYKCRCVVGCTVDGQCISGGCQGGWFGPACQYADLAYNTQSTITDGDDNTCLTYPLLEKNVTVGLMNQTLFTWLRVRVSKSGFVRHLTVKFKDDLSLACHNPRNASVDKTTLDIHCDLGELIQSVTLSGIGVHFLCSVYVSGGMPANIFGDCPVEISRNVALKQPTTQSSTYNEQNDKTSGKLEYFPTRLSVDGNTSSNFSYGAKSCSQTTSKDPIANWSLRFPLPQLIQRCVIYNRNDHSYQMTGFSLQSFGQDGNILLNYTDPNIQALAVYYVTTSTTVTSPVYLIKITARNSNLSLQLCEVEVYGDSVCDKGKYGRECEHDCNCEGGKTCFISTGGCPSGCKAGFYGESCNLFCRPGAYALRYGSGCSQFCAKNMSDKRSCDHINSALVDDRVDKMKQRACYACSGHVLEYLWPVSTCGPGTYGLNCSSNCSEFCAKNVNDERSCDHVNGSCRYGCSDGYKGQDCLTRCTPETYGPGCSKNCSQFCVKSLSDERSCDHVNGSCFSGCQNGYDGDNCSLPLKGSSGSDGNTNSIIGAVLGSILGIIFTLLVMSVFMRKHIKAKLQTLKDSSNEINWGLLGAALNSPSDTGNAETGQSPL